MWLDLILTIEKTEAIAKIPKRGFKCQGFERSLNGVHVKMEVFDEPTPLGLCVSVLLTFSALLYAFDEIELEFEFDYDGKGSSGNHTVGRVTVWRDGGHLDLADGVGSQKPALVATS